MTAQSLASAKMVHAAHISRRKFQQSRGQVGHIDRTTDVVGEQDPVAGPSGQLVHSALVLGLPVADDQRRPCDHGPRMHEKAPGLRRCLGRPVGSDRIRPTRLVVTNTGPRENGVRGHMNQTAAALRHSHRRPDSTLGRDRPIRPPLEALTTTDGRTLARTSSTLPGSRRSRGCHATPTVLPGLVAYVAAVGWPANTACRPSSAPRNQSVRPDLPQGPRWPIRRCG